MSRPLLQCVTIISLIKQNSRFVQEDLKSVHSGVEATLVAVVTKGEPYPPPGRAIRNAVANTLVFLYSRGECKSLFDTLIAFIKPANDFKAPADRDAHRTYVFAFR